MAAIRPCVRFLRPKVLNPLLKNAGSVKLNALRLKTSHNLSQHASRSFSCSGVMQKKEPVTIKFRSRDGKTIAAKASVGDNLLDVIIDNDIDIDGFGACEGTMACSTCHLIFKQPDYDSIPDKPTDEELDMLDLAYGLTDTSRLGCQVYVRKDMEGWEVTVPAAVADAREP